MRKIILLTLLLALPLVCFGQDAITEAMPEHITDTVILKNGRIITGNIIEKTDTYIKIVFEREVVTFAADEVEKIEPALKTHGLKLKLDTISSYENLKNHHTIKLSLVNEGKDPISLIAEWPDYYFDGDYADFLKMHVLHVFFTTEPEVEIPLPNQAIASSDGVSLYRKRKLPQLTLLLKPNESLVLEWNYIDKRNLDLGESTLYFPSSGTYYIRAYAEVKTSDGKWIDLSSNKQPLSFGNTLLSPKPSTAKVIEIDKDKKMVRLDVGANDRIQKGDKFIIYSSKFKSLQYSLEIMSVSEESSEAIVVSIQGQSRFVPSLSNTTFFSYFPSLDEIAYLQPDK